MADYYVDFDTGDDAGAGTAGDPWATISHAYATAADSADDTILCSGTTLTEVNSLYFTGRTNALTIKPDTGSGPTGTGPQLKVESSQRYGAVVSFNGDTVTWDGISVHNTRDSTPGVSVDFDSSGGTVKNCIVTGTNIAARRIDNVNSAAMTLHNVLVIGGSSGIGIGVHLGTAAVIRQCVVAGAATGIDQNNGSGSAACAVSGCLFYSLTTDGNFGNTPTAYRNATTKGTAEGWGSNWKTSVSTTAGTDIEDASIDDYRCVSGGVLEDWDQTGNAPAADMFGTSRPLGSYDDVGYYEVAAAGGGNAMPMASGHYRRRRAG